MRAIRKRIFVELQQQLFQRATDIMGALRTMAVNRTASVIVPITTLGEGPYQLVRDLPIVVQPIEDAYTATFFDANASMSGDTQEEAVESLKAYIVDLLEDLESEPPESLGPGPARQLAALRAVIRRVN